MIAEEEYSKIINERLIDWGYPKHMHENLCFLLRLSYLEGGRDADVVTLRRIEANKFKRETR